MTRTVDQSIKPSGNNDLTSARRHVDDGIAHAHEGAWVPARDAFERAAESAPEWPDGFHNLSIALTQLGDRSGALSAARQATALSGAGPAVWLNLGNLAAQSDDLETAEGAYSSVLAMDTHSADAHLNLGIVLSAQNRWVEAAEHLSVAHDAMGREINTGVLLARALRDSGQPEDALARLQTLSDSASWNVEGLYERALCHALLGDGVYALADTNQLLALEPAHYRALILKAELLATNDAWEDFYSFLEDADTWVPNGTDFNTEVAARLIEHRKTTEAVKVAQRLVQRHPDTSENLTTLGTCYWENLDYAEAIAAYEQALAHDPKHLSALQSLSSLLFELNEFGKALKYAERALEADRTDERSLKTLSLIYLAIGRLAEGWDYGEHPRSSLRENARAWIDPSKSWEGKDLTDKILRIRPEQGIGDEMRFATCFPDAIADAKKCVIECDPRLQQIFERTYPEAKFIPVELDDRLKGKFPPYTFDLECLAGSLPRRYRRSLSAFPEQPRTLKTDPALGDKWRRRLDALGPTFKIGLCWRSNVIDRQRMRRFFYTHSDDWEQLYALEGVSFINLFPGATKYEIDVVREKFGVTLHQWDDLDLKDDIDDILSLINELDLVITVQAAVWTFAGALGKDALVILNPNVLMGSARVPWFPSVEPITSVWTDPWQTVSAEIAGKVRQRIDRKSRQMTEG